MSTKQMPPIEEVFEERDAPEGYDWFSFTGEQDEDGAVSVDEGMFSKSLEDANELAFTAGRKLSDPGSCWGVVSRDGETAWLMGVFEEDDQTGFGVTVIKDGKVVEADDEAVQGDAKGEYIVFEGDPRERRFPATKQGFTDSIAYRDEVITDAEREEEVE